MPLCVCLAQLDEAIVHASKAAQLRSRDPEFHILLGSLYVKTGNVTDAIAAYQQALIADPSLKEAHVRLADLFSSIGREDDAKRHYQEALRVDPSYKWAHVNLGLSLERQVRPILNVFNDASSYCALSCS